MKVECTRGFGKVEDPETGEEIDVQEPFETDQETFERLDEYYPGFRVIEQGESEAGEDYPTNGDGEPLCVGKEDGQCSRTVDESGGVCWQH